MERRERGMRGRQSKGGGREGGEGDKVREEGDGGNERRERQSKGGGRWWE